MADAPFVKTAASGVLKDFTTSAFPTAKDLTAFPASGGYVYAICWLEEGREVPLYVGQTKALRNRIGHYQYGDFTATADFRVAEAIRHLRDSCNRSIVVRYQAAAEPATAERALIRQLQLQGNRLLNELIAYQYKYASKDGERTAIQRFCDLLLMCGRCDQVLSCAESAND